MTIKGILLKMCTLRDELAYLRKLIRLEYNLHTFLNLDIYACRKVWENFSLDLIRGYNKTLMATCIKANQQIKWQQWSMNKKSV